MKGHKLTRTEYAALAQWQEAVLRIMNISPYCAAGKVWDIGLRDSGEREYFVHRVRVETTGSADLI